MLNLVYRKRFEKELLKAKKRGKDIEKLKEIIDLLLAEKPLPSKSRNHKLVGNHNGLWECHIEPDWLWSMKKQKQKSF